ncbi:MAG: hypothetical protein QOF83_62 [Solirubrobacteraceae bacterium]|jgi:hypothetical protein|nr:hypothetical protein [Solirubrobacteraceae bacterium]
MMPLLLRRPGLRWAAAAALAVIVLAACGQTTRVGPSRTFQVALTEYHVAPQSVRVPAGTVSIFVHNYGRLSHNLVISTGARPLASTQPIPPGETTELIAPLVPGTYLMASTVLSDQALGAYGTLTVTR